MLLPAFADHHVHLGLVDPSGLAASGIGRVVDLGWSDAVVGLAAAAPVACSTPAGSSPLPAATRAPADGRPRGGTSEVAEPSQADGAVSAQVALGASVIKATLNRDAGPVPDLATLGGRGGRRRRCGLTVVAHAQGPGMVELAIAAGVGALAHTPWTHRLDDEVVAEAVDAGQAWISTLDIHGYGTARPTGNARWTTWPASTRPAGGCSTAPTSATGRFPVGAEPPGGRPAAWPPGCPRRPCWRR